MVEFTARMGAKESIRISPCESPNLFAKPAADYKGPGLAVAWVETEGPLIDAWPPAAAVRLLGKADLDRGVAADAETILRRFAPRAFRRPVADAELAPYIALVKSRLAKGYSFEAALRLGLAGLLCSPDFLYLSATPGKLNDFDLAARLSYFLWSTTPDDTLADLAGRGVLGKPDVLRQQVARMLQDAKAHAFTENFTGQWLSLRNLKATIPDKKLYPDFDDLLELSMPRETHLFFEELIKEDRSVLEFVHSDWTMLNERLARHYNIPGVIGSGFPQDEVARGLPPGRGNDPGGGAQGDRERDEHVAGDPGGVGARPHPGRAVPAAAEGRARHRAGHPRGEDHPRAVGQAPADPELRRLPRPDRPAGQSRWKTLT